MNRVDDSHDPLAAQPKKRRCPVGVNGAYILETAAMAR
jgi:hypothetical protein